MVRQGKDTAVAAGVPGRQGTAGIDRADSGAPLRVDRYVGVGEIAAEVDRRRTVVAGRDRQDRTVQVGIPVAHCTALQIERRRVVARQDADIGETAADSDLAAAHRHSVDNTVGPGNPIGEAAPAARVDLRHIAGADTVDVRKVSRHEQLLAHQLQIEHGVTFIDIYIQRTGIVLDQSQHQRGQPLACVAADSRKLTTNKKKLAVARQHDVINHPVTIRVPRQQDTTAPCLECRDAVTGIVIIDTAKIARQIDNLTVWPDGNRVDCALAAVRIKVIDNVPAAGGITDPRHAVAFDVAVNQRKGAAQIHLRTNRYNRANSTVRRWIPGHDNAGSSVHRRHIVALLRPHRIRTVEIAADIENLLVFRQRQNAHNVRNLYHPRYIHPAIRLNVYQIFVR